LKAIAEATGGLYAPLGAQGQGLETIYQQALAPLAKHDLASRRQKVYTERFQWPLAASLALLLTSMLFGTRRRNARKHATPAPEMARPPFMVHSAAAMLGVLLFSPLHQAQASPAAAEQAYQKGDFATAQREYAAAAQHNTNAPDLQFNIGTAAYKAGQFPQAAEAFQKSLGSEPSADAKRLAAQEDAYYNLGDTLYRSGQKTEQSQPQQTIQSWEQAVKTYEAALQLHANDADATYNRDFVKQKLEELKKKQEQQKKDQQKKDEQKQKQDQKDKDQKNQSGQNSDQKNQQNKDQKPDQKNQSGQNSEAKNQDNKDQKPGKESKPDQQKDQQQANSGSKPDQQKQPDQAGQQPKPDQQKDQPKANSGSKPDQQKQSDQAGQQPKPANGQPQGDHQAQAGADQRKDEAAQAADSQREPGQMSKQEARALLDSLKSEERRLPAAPVARNSTNDQRTDQPIKDW
jgi:Ca-activated chloride channel family protein